jgi:DUF1009 family protein
VTEALPPVVGIIAGWGRFPILVAESLKRRGTRVVVVAFAGEAEPSLQTIADSFRWCAVAQVGKLVRSFREQGVKTVCMAGGIRKPGMYSPWKYLRYRPDLTFFRLWHRALVDKRDSTIIGTFARFLEDEGLELAAIDRLCPELLGSAGRLSARAPTAAEEADMALAYETAREMARLEVGQSVLVREGAVVAVEAIEGTDAAIRRAGELARRGGFVLVKVARPDQDMRWDVPTIGPSTVLAMARAGGVAIGYEAGRTLVLDIAETVRRADELGVALVGLTDGDVSATRARVRDEAKRAAERLGRLGAVVNAEQERKSS